MIVSMWSAIPGWNGLNDSTRVWIYYIGNSNINSNVNTSRHTIENISNKTFDLVFWLNNKNFRVWKQPLFIKTKNGVRFGLGLSSAGTKEICDSRLSFDRSNNFKSGVEIIVSPLPLPQKVKLKR